MPIFDFESPRRIAYSIWLYQLSSGTIDGRLAATSTKTSKWIEVMEDSATDGGQKARRTSRSGMFSFNLFNSFHCNLFLVFFLVTCVSIFSQVCCCFRFSGGPMSQTDTIELRGFDDADDRGLKKKLSIQKNQKKFKEKSNTVRKSDVSFKICYSQ